MDDIEKEILDYFDKYGNSKVENIRNHFLINYPKTIFLDNKKLTSLIGNRIRFLLRKGFIKRFISKKRNKRKIHQIYIITNSGKNFLKLKKE